MAKYNKKQINPFTKEWEKTGVAILTEQDAETLNDSSKHTGVKYEAVKETKTKK